MKENKGNIYDRIFKENIEALFLPLVAQTLDMEITTYKALPTEFSKTKTSRCCVLSSRS